MAVLASSTSSDFAFLREHLGVSDSDLSKQTAALEAAGYVTITKTHEGRTPATYVALTGTGRVAFETYTATLRTVLGGAS